jgi:hypothetical protein
MGFVVHPLPAHVFSLRSSGFRSQGRQEQSSLSAPRSLRSPGNEVCRSPALSQGCLKTIRTIVLIVCGIDVLGRLIAFGMPVLVAGALRARAGKVFDDFHRQAVM